MPTTMIVKMCSVVEPACRAEPGLVAPIRRWTTARPRAVRHLVRPTGAGLVYGRELIVAS
jgi:hypothetical protein